jgi:ribosomal protein S18 acetylase RimI-like enzyme
MNAERHSSIEVTVGMARPEELPILIGIYREHCGGDWRDVGCHNTFVARDPKGAVAGAITIEKVNPGWTSLRTMGVDPAFGHQGVGTQLVLGVVEKLRNEGNQSITLDLNPHGAYSIEYQKRFYESLGFKELDSRSMIYKPG